MLAYPPCPVCGGELPLKAFFKEWNPTSKYDAQNPALECPSCGDENPGHFELCWKCKSKDLAIKEAS